MGPASFLFVAIVVAAVSSLLCAAANAPLTIFFNKALFSSLNLPKIVSCAAILLPLKCTGCICCLGRYLALSGLAPRWVNELTEGMSIVPKLLSLIYSCPDSRKGTF